MRNRSASLMAVLLLAAAPAAAQAPQPGGGQQPPQPGQQAPAAPGTVNPASPFTITADVGALASSVEGDAARFQRYRDLRDGLYSSFTLNRQTSRYLFDGRATHVGYRDQSYAASFLSRRANVGFQFTGVPVNFLFDARTPFSDGGGSGLLLLDDAAQRAVQGPTNAANDGTAVGVPCAPGALPASCSTPALAEQAKANRSIYNSLTREFDMRYQRNVTSVTVNVPATRAVDVDARFVSTSREGEQPFGASFAFNNAIELALPLEQRTNDFSLGLAYTRPRGSVRIGWDGSWFNNDIDSVTWDNPIRIGDFSNGLVPPAGPYDPSGYSNGNGAAQGRMAVMPANMMNVVSLTGMYKLPRRTTVNGVVQLTNHRQDEPLIGWTSNSVINQPLVFSAFPGLAALPRATADAEAQGVNTLVNLSSRPWRLVSFTVRYRFNDRDVRTRPFDASDYVAMDATPEHAEHGLTHEFDTQRGNFDSSVSFTPARWGTLRVGYGHEAIERHGRGFSDVGENLFRVSFDTLASSWVSLRASFDAGRRRGEGFVEAAAAAEDDLGFPIGSAGTQPTLRYFDEADRDRTRGTLLLTVMPRDTVDVFVQFQGGRDRYLADDNAPVSRPNELFGLQESDVTSWNAGVNFSPTEVVSVGASYGRENLSAFQRSRNANPPPDPTWNDRNRDWSLDNDEQMNTVSLFIDLLRAVRDTDVRVAYDYSDSDNAYVHGGPRITALAAAGQFIPLPDVENSWHRLSADVQYFLSARAGVGLGYVFEKLDVVDWRTIDSAGPVGFAPQTGLPRIDWLGGLVTGYGNRPYTGHAASLRLLYRF